ncbi:MAG: hypothetical protein K1X44_03715 [Alphaproteobacteria bacterium]|nr:hypothetical protein [Alphaproteobacteria bacterium]
MPPQKNPLRLNPLQLKTLALFQILAGTEGHYQKTDDSQNILIHNIPHPHGDHFHIGEFVVSSQDASGLSNISVWVALERKGFIQSMFPEAAILSPLALDYDTGIRQQILHHSHH